MEEYKIHIEQNLSDDYCSILQEYWEIDGNEFLNKPKQICAKYNITIGELSKIIKDFSYCKVIYGYCIDCGIIKEDKLYSQTSFREKKRRYFKERCEICEEKYYKEREANKIKQQEEESKQLEECFNKAIQEKKWNELSDEELETLRGIVRLKNKSLIYKEIFNGNPFDNSIWRKVGSIERRNLLFVRRNPSKSVIDFLFSDKLEEILLGKDETRINEELDFLSFSMSKNINKTSIRQPDYSGTFILRRAIRLEAEIKYIYGGWLNTDGSINLKIQPLENIFQNVEHGKIENEPTHIKNILDNFFNKIEINDREE